MMTTGQNRHNGSKEMRHTPDGNIMADTAQGRQDGIDPSPIADDDTTDDGMAAFAPTHLMTALRDTPLGIGETRPRLWWEDPLCPTHPHAGHQCAYEIRLADGRHAGDSTGWVASERCTALAWPFTPLAPLESCSWQVRVRMADADGTTCESGWSAPQQVVRGPESADLWKIARPIWSASGTPVTAQEPGPAHCPDGTLHATLLLAAQTDDNSDGPAVSGSGTDTATGTTTAPRAVRLLARGAADGNDGYSWRIETNTCTGRGSVTGERKMNGAFTPLGSAQFRFAPGAATLDIDLTCRAGTASLRVDGTDCLRVDGIEDAGGAWGLEADEQEADFLAIRLEDDQGHRRVDIDPADPGCPLPWFTRRRQIRVDADQRGSGTTAVLTVPAHTTGMLGEPGGGDYWALLRRRIDLPNGTIAAARVFACASNPLGARQYVYQLAVNGRHAGTGSSRAVTGPLYETHDITRLLHPGANVISALCWAQTGGWLRALLQIVYTDGRTMLLGTDGSWQARSGCGWRPWNGDLNRGVHYYVAPREDIDARQEPVGWQSDSSWDDAACRANGFAPALVRDTGSPEETVPHADPSSPTVRRVSRPASVRRISPTRWLVDAGIESAYSVSLTIAAQRAAQTAAPETPRDKDLPLPGLSGLRLRLRMGEQLEDEKAGTVRFETLSCMRFEDVWTLRSGEQSLCHWGYRGFRWLQADVLPPSPAASGPSPAASGPVTGTAADASPTTTCDLDPTADIDPAALDVIDTALRTGLSLETEVVPEPDQTGTFDCDDPDLGRDLTDVWDLCATSIREGRQDLFMDTPVRERMPYEGDALTHGRCEMALSRSYDITRKTWRYLARRPGKFTEYRFMMAPLAWEEYLETGDIDALRADWRLLWDEQAFGLLDEATGLVTKDPKMPGCTDIVDWPQPGELDGFVFRPTNTVVNVWALQGFEHLSLIAGAVGLHEQSDRARTAADRLHSALRQEMADPATGAWRDGLGTDHTALHSTLYALSLDACETALLQAGGRWLAAYDLPAGLPISPNAATWLLEALMASGQDQTALEVMASHSPTSWWSMRHHWGATQTMEGWSPDTKWNTTFAHPWAAGPLWVIARRVLGVRVDAPGAAHIAISPNVGNLSCVRGTVATVRGLVGVEITRNAARFTLPANMTATLRLDGRERTLESGTTQINRA